MAGVWVDGALQILRTAAQHGAPTPRTAPWQGRWWSLWGASDLLPLGDRVFVANPGLANPLLDAPQIEAAADASGATRQGHFVLAGGFASHGETVRLEHDARGRAQALWLGGTRLQTEAQAAKELARRYGGVLRTQGRAEPAALPAQPAEPASPLRPCSGQQVGHLVPQFGRHAALVARVHAALAVDHQHQGQPALALPGRRQLHITQPGADERALAALRSRRRRS